MTASGNCYRVIVVGRIAQAATELIDARFGSAASIEANGTDTAVQLTVDQSALRALLNMLWDVGHDVSEISQSSDASQDLSSPLHDWTSRSAFETTTKEHMP